MSVLERERTKIELEMGERTLELTVENVLHLQRVVVSVEDVEMDLRR